ncbi:hypothetical protein PM082_022734 [Marasmius tenuissimus]|nr:hypothetical protein PM082_022734 [Marasmius tenuissimus]
MQQFWTATILPSRPLTFVPDLPLCLTNAALGTGIVDFLSRTTLFVRESGSMNNDKRAAITSLKFGTLESFSYQVYLTQGTMYTLEVEGPNSITVVGYYERPIAKPPVKPAAKVPAAKVVPKATPVKAPAKPSDEETRKRKREADNSNNTDVNVDNVEEERKVKIRRSDVNAVAGPSKKTTTTDASAIAGPSKKPTARRRAEPQQQKVEEEEEELNGSDE